MKCSFACVVLLLFATTSRPAFAAAGAEIVTVTPAEDEKAVLHNPNMGWVLYENFPLDAKVKEKVMAKGDPKARLAELVAALPAMDFSSDAAIEAGIKALAEGKGLGFGDYQAVARLAVTGTNTGPSITSIFRVLSRDRVLQRLQRFAAL